MISTMQKSFSHSFIISILFISTSLVLLSACSSSGSPPSSSLVVTNTADSGAGSLRQVISDSVIDGIITFDSSLTGSIILTSDELVISRNLTIDGLGASVTIIDGNNMFRIFRITTGASVELRNMTITNGNGGNTRENIVGTPGAGILVELEGKLQLIDAEVTNNNTKLISARGGGIFIDGAHAVLTRVLVSGNTASQGAGILIDFGSLDVFDSTISNNTAIINAGGISIISATSTISNSIIDQNSATDANSNGGGISVTPYMSGDSASVDINLTTIKNNTSGNAGGGIYINDAIATLRQVKISGNSASQGGGILIDFGSLNIFESFISKNIAIQNSGGISILSATSTIINSTIDQNSATDPGSNGGGISISPRTTGDPTTVNLSFSTITNNNTGNEGGGIFSNNGITLNIRNSIVAGNTAGTASPDIRNEPNPSPQPNPPIVTTINSQGYNFFGDATGSIGITDSVNNDQAGDTATPLDPLLEALITIDNLVTIYALNTASPASNIIPLANCLDNFDSLVTVDGSTNPRPENAGTLCDIGSYENP